MKKKHSHTYWHRLLDKKFGDWLRETNKECAKCHKPFEVQMSHILPKGRYQGLRYDPINVLPLCGGCHRWFWHDNPLEAHRWFAENYPERLIYLNEAKNLIVKRNEGYYQSVNLALDQKNVRKLLILGTSGLLTDQ